MRKRGFLKFIGKAITRMNINVLTIFPEIFEILNSGVISKACLLYTSDAADE